MAITPLNTGVAPPTGAQDPSWTQFNGFSLPSIPQADVNAGGVDQGWLQQNLGAGGVNGNNYQWTGFGGNPATQYVTPSADGVSAADLQQQQQAAAAAGAAPGQFGVEVKSGDKQGTDVQYVLDPNTGMYVPQANSANNQYWNTSAADNNKDIGIFLATAASLGGAAGAFGAGGAAAGDAGGASIVPSTADAATTGAVVGSGGEALGAGGGAAGFGAADAAGASGTFLPATSDATATPLAPDLASQFGIVGSTPDAGAGAGAGVFGSVGGGSAAAPAVSSGFGSAANAGPELVGDAGTGAGLTAGDAGVASVSGTGASSAGDWLSKLLSNPKQLASLGLSGVSLLQALSKPKLPSYSQAAASSAQANLAQANATIASGGTSAPQWQAQKAAIDSSIQQQLDAQTRALQQSMANAGEGGANSAVVQQQLNNLKSNLENQRNQLYLQAQGQNVQQAITQLTGDNQVLTGVGNMQWQQSQAAQQQALNTAKLIASLYAQYG